MKHHVKVTIPFEAESLEEAIRLANGALKASGFIGFEVEKPPSCSCKEVCDECGAECPDNADSLFGNFHAEHCSLNPKNTV